VLSVLRLRPVNREKGMLSSMQDVKERGWDGRREGGRGYLQHKCLPVGAIGSPFTRQCTDPDVIARFF